MHVYQLCMTYLNSSISLSCVPLSVHQMAAYFTHSNLQPVHMIDPGAADSPQPLLQAQEL